ncbi:MAG: [FeFe] hydrogenase H-cluster radical SAM maturase HydE [Candidatus Firestonebacteria bacterium]
MCYSIPGKVLAIDGKMVTVEYFGEQRRAKNEFYDLIPGQYVYAQGGFVVSTVEVKEAEKLLQNWKEVFLKLKEKDLRLAREPKTLYQIANAVRQKHQDNSCCVHGIIKFSNYCSCDCMYCGIRKNNKEIKRYRMTIDEIVKQADKAVNKLGFKALVLQSGEDPWYTEEKLLGLVKKIREKCGVLIVLSIGDRPVSVYKNLYEAGAKSALIRFETANEKIYASMKEGKKLKDRLELINKLKETGYLVMSGFLIGLPGQTEHDLMEDIRLTGDINPEMFSFGPFIPHKGTPLAKERIPALNEVITVIARARILYPESKIVVTTALETLDKKGGARKGLMSGANSLMINLTPEKYRDHYEIYPGRKGMEQTVEERIQEVLKLLESIGRAPTDIGLV